MTEEQLNKHLEPLLEQLSTQERELERLKVQETGMEDLKREVIELRERLYDIEPSATREPNPVPERPKEIA